MMHVIHVRPIQFATLAVAVSFAAGCQLVSAPMAMKDVVVTVFNESHDTASLVVLDRNGIPVGIGDPPLVAGATHADIRLHVPTTGQWDLWINRGEPGAGMIISNADVGSCTGRLPIQIRVGPARELSWSGQPFC